ncbi:hypothetical protein CAPTEDRAFT_158452 [Capitella teleta]|uniref:ADP-ribosylglycohydrolase n=1 Tax=Capitella teleta TaxID=283909 RepID=R7TWS7_CAPTE|nr:hypothetical protein CAPTEDRAFT_158452 [Capitella teleta]|eukprot:ELT98348.1 hypothetical protein CAPTEDRAFT_158452 [Capitella teleta]
MRATIYGNCIGDAIGLLSEFMSKEMAHEVRKAGKMEYKHKLEDVHRLRWKNGDWTDDSDQMILIMDSIVDCGGEVDPVDYAKKLRFWVENGFPELGDAGGIGLGQTTHRVVRCTNFTTDPFASSSAIWERSNRHAAPNGAVMRTSVVGTHRYQSLEAVKKNAMDFCKVTHFSPKCQASTIAVSTAVALMLQRPERLIKKSGAYDVQKLIGEAYDQAKTVFEGDDESRQELHKVLFCKNIDEHELADDPKIGYTYKTLGAGFWALQQTDFRKALETIILEGGDADTNGAVAGALLGCKLGLKGLPRSWLKDLVHKEWLDKKIERYFNVINGSNVKESSLVEEGATGPAEQ